MMLRFTSRIVLLTRTAASSSHSMQCVSGFIGNPTSITSLDLYLVCIIRRPRFKNHMVNGRGCRPVACTVSVFPVHTDSHRGPFLTEVLAPPAAGGRCPSHANLVGSARSRHVRPIRPSGNIGRTALYSNGLYITSSHDNSDIIGYTWQIRLRRNMLPRFRHPDEAYQMNLHISRLCG